MCSAAVLFLLMVVRARADPKALLRRMNSHRVRAARGRRLLGGSILYAAQSIGFQLAANLTSIANELIIVALMPLCGAVWEHVLLGMALQRHTWIACGICVVFVAAVITDSYMRQGETSAALEGDLIALTVPLAMGLYFCAMKEPAKNGSSKVQKQALGSQPSHPHALEVPHAHTHALTVVGVPTAGESDKCGIDRHSESDDTPVMVVILGNLLAARMKTPGYSPELEKPGLLPPFLQGEGAETSGGRSCGGRVAPKWFAFLIWFGTFVFPLKNRPS